MLETVFRRHYCLHPAPLTTNGLVRLSVASISALVMLPQALPDHVGRPPPANGSYPRLEPPTPGYRKAANREKIEALSRRPRRAASESRSRSGAASHEDPIALRHFREPRERRINLPPSARPSRQFVTQFIAQQVLPHDVRGETGFATDGARSYAAARSRAEQHIGPNASIEIRA